MKPEADRIQLINRLFLVQVAFPLYRQSLLSELATRVGTLILVNDQSDARNLKQIDNITQIVTAGSVMHRPVVHRWFRGFLWQTNLIRHLASDRPDVAVFQGSVQFISIWLALLFCRIVGIPAFLWSHGARGAESHVKMILRMLMTRLSRGILVYGHHAERILVKYKVPEKKIHVVYNSLGPLIPWSLVKASLQPDAQLRRDLFPGNPALPIAVFVGRILDSKHLDYILDCLAMAVQRNKPFNFLCVGTGPMMDSLKDITRKLKICEFVYFYGETFDAETLARLIGQAAVCVSPGSVGLTAIHAMSCGIPVITHDRFDIQGPEFEAIRPGVTGDLYAFDDKEALYTCMQNWFDKVPERSATARLCWELVADRYTPDAQADRMINAISCKAV